MVYCMNGSIVFRTLIDPLGNELDGAIGQVRSTDRHSASKRRVRRELCYEGARPGFPRDDCSSMTSTLEKLRNSLQGESATSPVAANTPVRLEDRTYVILK